MSQSAQQTAAFTRPENSPARVILSDELALCAARAVAELALRDAATRDRERIYPLEALELFSRSGLGSISVPREFGGGGLSYRTVAEVFRIISAADPSLWQIPQNHFGLIQFLRDEGTFAQQQRLFAAVVQGQRLGNGGPEKNSRHARDVQARLRQREGGLRLSGSKFYSTGALIDGGIARGAFDEACAFVRQHSRPWVDAGVERNSDDPHLQADVGRVWIEIAAADALLRRAARFLDEVDPASLDAATAARASIVVAEAKVLTTQAALKASEKLLEWGGSRATLAEHNLDRHWRNARTHTLHDPIRWKFHAIGNYYLNGVFPVRHAWI